MPLQRSLLTGYKRPPKQPSYGSGKKQRFWPCPVCNRSFTYFTLEDHVNQCLDSSSSGTSQSHVLPSINSPNDCPSGSTSCDGPGFWEKNMASLISQVKGRVPSPPRTDNSVAPLPRKIGSPCLVSSTPVYDIRGAEELTIPSKFGTIPSISDSHIFEEKGGSSSALEERFFMRGQDAILSASTSVSAGMHSLGPTSEGSTDEIPCEMSHCPSVNGAILYSGELKNAQPKCLQDVSKRGAYREVLAPSPPDIHSFRTGKTLSTGLMDDEARGQPGAAENLRDRSGRDVDRPPAGFKLFQRQKQSQARISMFWRVPSSAPVRQKPTVTVLQPGMVLFRSWLDLEQQQLLVQESQRVAHLFHRPITSGGGKYHIYSMCWGPKWDTRAHRYVSEGSEWPLPLWMFELSQKIAQDAQQHTSVYPLDSIFAPEVGLVNFYPVKADELGVVGLGGHQDLDDSCSMPVVSLSVGDSMTFFYRRFPPLSRRKSGVFVAVDNELTKNCADGDVAHNREHEIILNSGDVIVFGGESRLVYHGTRNVQAGTRPPGLHMVPGRLNFTFRQIESKS